MGEYSYFGPNLAPNHDPDSWNYPYDHYRGFITGSVEGGSYSQRKPHPHPQPDPARFVPSSDSPCPRVCVHHYTSGPLLRQIPPRPRP